MIYCFDLDNTLCETKGGDYQKARPFISRIKLVNLLYDQGHTIIIETARGSMTGIDWMDVTTKQLKEWGVKYNQVRGGVKIPADIYVDDRGVNADNFFDEKG